MLKRIQLSRPSSTECCITEGGTAQAHALREHVGSLSRKTWTLRRMLVEVRKGADSPKPPQERGLSHAAPEAAPNNSIPCNTSRRTSIEERHASVRRNGVTFAMYCDFGGERNLVQRHSTPDEAGAVW